MTVTTLRMIATIGFLLQSGAASPQTERPAGAQARLPTCPRNISATFTVVGAELTQASANPVCMPPPTPCNMSWNFVQTLNLPSPRWSGPPTHRFNISEQNGIIASARAAAVQIAPTGTRVFRVEFTSQAYGMGPHPSYEIRARGFYGRCGLPH